MSTAAPSGFTRRALLSLLGSGVVVASAALLALGGSQAHAQETIKVGVLHSLSGTMAISETVLKDTVLMAIDEINASGGVLGKKVEPVVVDRFFRFEGPSDPADEAIVLGVHCSACGARGTIVSAFGPDADVRGLTGVRGVDVVGGVTSPAAARITGASWLAGGHHRRSDPLRMSVTPE